MPRRTAAPPHHTKPPIIVVTGGGTGGHVIPALAVIREIEKHSPKADIHYVGAADSIEEQLATKDGVPFHAVAVGKLRRYFSWENFRDALRIPLGIAQAIRLLRHLKPDTVFAKGGFVSVPAALAAGILNIPLIIHESDATSGLATRLATPFATKICLSFPNAHTAKSILTGNPVRPVGNAARGIRFLKFKRKKPLILVAGGSTGAGFLNELVSASLTALTAIANIVVVTGSGKQLRMTNDKLHTNVRVFEFLGPEYLDVLAATDLVVSRAGANALAELALAAKPAIVVPLPATGSRGDQLVNAEIFAAKKAIILREQSALTPTIFTALIRNTLADKKKCAALAKNIHTFARPDAAARIAAVILATIKK